MEQPFSDRAARIEHNPSYKIAELKVHLATYKAKFKNLERTVNLLTIKLSALSEVHDELNEDFRAHTKEVA